MTSVKNEVKKEVDDITPQEATQTSSTPTDDKLGTVLKAATTAPEYHYQKKGNKTRYDKAQFIEWVKLGKPSDKLYYNKWHDLKTDNRWLYDSKGRRVIFTDDIDAVLYSLYFNPKTGYLGTNKFYSIVNHYFAGITRERVANFLFRNETHQQHKERPKNTTFKPLRPKAPNKIWQIDLIDMSSLAPYNNRFHWCLTCIDLFTKFAWVRPIPSKHAARTVVALQSILDDADTKKNGELPGTIQTDNGTEFKAEFDALLIEKGIKHVMSQPYNPSTQGQVERFNKTIKTMLARYMTANNTKKWIDVIQELCAAYNTSKQTTIKHAPADAYTNREDDTQNSKIKANINTKADARIRNDMSILKPGDRVRVALEQFKEFRKQHYRKAYQRQWSQEIYVVRNKVQHKSDHINNDYYRLDQDDGTPMKVRLTY